MLLRRGDIVLADFAPARAGEANYTRPAIIVTNNQANALAPVAVVIPLTSNTDKVYPMQLFLPSEQTGLDRDSKAQVELIRHISLQRIQKVIGYLLDELIEQLNERVREHLAI